MYLFELNNFYARELIISARILNWNIENTAFFYSLTETFFASGTYAVIGVVVGVSAARGVVIGMVGAIILTEQELMYQEELYCQQQALLQQEESLLE